MIVAVTVCRRYAPVPRPRRRDAGARVEQAMRRSISSLCTRAPGARLTPRPRLIQRASISLRRSATGSPRVGDVDCHGHRTASEFRQRINFPFTRSWDADDPWAYRPPLAITQNPTGPHLQLQSPALRRVRSPNSAPRIRRIFATCWRSTSPARPCDIQRAPARPAHCAIDPGHRGERHLMPPAANTDQTY